MNETFKGVPRRPGFADHDRNARWDKFFFACWDLKAPASGNSVHRDYGVSGFGGLQDLRDLNKPVIACVNGMAVGGRVKPSLSRDLIYASFVLHQNCLPPASLIRDRQTARAHPCHIALELLYTCRRMDPVERTAGQGFRRNSLSNACGRS